eukprot:3534817-Rhodomonas_salina.1
MLGVHTLHAIDKTQVKSGSDVAGEVDEMEGIELEAEGYEEGVEPGLSAFEVSESETRWCTRGDGEAGPFLDPLQI